MSRFLVFSDLHLNNWKYGSSASFDRLRNQLQFLEYIGSYAAENNIKYILFCGDFFHTSGYIRTEVLQGAYQLLKSITEKYQIELIFIAGNHDQADREGQIHAVDFLSQFGHHVHGDFISLPNFPVIGGFDYTENEEYLNSFLNRASEIKDPLVLLLHQGVNGVEVNSKGFKLNELLTPDMIPDNVLHAFVGHYHSFKRVSSQITIPGSPTQFNWGDAGEERGFLDTTLNKNEIHSLFVPNEGSFNFTKLSFEELQNQIKVTEDEIGIPCLGHFTKITNVPNKAAAEEIRKLCSPCTTGTLEIEYEEQAKKEIESEKFDTFDQMFEEYIKDNEISGRLLEVGKEIMSEKYEAPTS